MIDQQLFENILSISYSFIFGGLIIVLMTIGTHNQSALIGTITGYSAAACATILISGLTYSTIANGNKTPQISDILSALGPMILLFIIFLFSLTLVSVYFDNISQNKVSNYYGMFSNMSILFILIQVYIFYLATNQKSFRENGYINKLTVMKLLLLSVINILILITEGVSLKYFSTDG
jgi:hypothetical protein